MDQKYNKVFRGIKHRKMHFQSPFDIIKSSKNGETSKTRPIRHRVDIILCAEEAKVYNFEIDHRKFGHSGTDSDPEHQRDQTFMD